MLKDIPGANLLENINQKIIISNMLISRLNSLMRKCQFVVHIGIEINKTQPYHMIYIDLNNQLLLKMK